MRVPMAFWDDSVVGIQVEAPEKADYISPDERRFRFGGVQQRESGATLSEKEDYSRLVHVSNRKRGGVVGNVIR